MSADDDHDFFASFFGSSSGGGGGGSSGGGSSGPQSVTLDAPSGEASEGIPFQLTGTILPAGYYSFEYTIEHNYGAFNYDPQTGAFSVYVLIPDDGPSPGNGTPWDIETITMNVYAVGQQSPAASDDVDVTVNNMAPTFIHPEYGHLLIDIYDYPLGGPYAVVNGSIHDYGSQDQHIVTIDWGDGSYDEFPLQGSIFSTHRYVPDGGDYTITVTVEDDDTGIGVYSEIFGMYLLDLEIDADGDGDIDEHDDPLEDQIPGGFIFINDDDDDENGVPDMEQAGPVAGEDDLEPILLGWSPTFRPHPDVLDYTNWSVVLTLDPAPTWDEYEQKWISAALVYTSPNKSGLLPFEATYAGMGLEWVVGTDEVPSVLYVEAMAMDKFSFSLKLLPPNANPVDSDTVVFWAASPRVKMDIGNGIEHAYVGRSRHAITVANLNDTDGDGKVDVDDDDGVKNTIKGVEYKELDLMPLKIFKPEPYDPTKLLTLTVKSGDVKFWKDDIKLEPINVAEFINTWGEETEKVLWVEATKASATTKSIHLQLRYQGDWTDVWATAVWATKTAVEHDRKTPEQLFAAFPNLKAENQHDRVESLIKSVRGTGLVPPYSVPFMGTWTHNGILFQFTVQPPGIHIYGKIIKFDVTRRDEIQVKFFNAAGDVIESVTETFPDKHPDAANDDGDDDSLHPDKDELMYSYDAPGFKFKGQAEVKTVTYDGKWEEFIRVNIGILQGPDDGPIRPNGGSDTNHVLFGSRASPLALWEVQHTLKHDPIGTLSRTTGDDPETEENHVRERES